MQHAGNTAGAAPGTTTAGVVPIPHNSTVRFQVPSEEALDGECEVFGFGKSKNKLPNWISFANLVRDFDHLPAITGTIECQGDIHRISYVPATRQLYLLDHVDFAPEVQSMFDDLPDEEVPPCLLLKRKPERLFYDAKGKTWRRGIGGDVINRDVELLHPPANISSHPTRTPFYPDILKEILRIEQQQKKR